MAWTLQTTVAAFQPTTSQTAGGSFTSHDSDNNSGESNSNEQTTYGCRSHITQQFHQTTYYSDAGTTEFGTTFTSAVTHREATAEYTSVYQNGLTSLTTRSYSGISFTDTRYNSSGGFVTVSGVTASFKVSTATATATTAKFPTSTTTATTTMSALTGLVIGTSTGLQISSFSTTITTQNFWTDSIPWTTTVYVTTSTSTHSAFNRTVPVIIAGTNEWLWIVTRFSSATGFSALTDIAQSFLTSTMDWPTVSEVRDYGSFSSPPSTRSSFSSSIGTTTLTVRLSTISTISARSVSSTSNNTFTSTMQIWTTATQTYQSAVYASQTFTNSNGLTTTALIVNPTTKSFAIETRIHTTPDLSLVSTTVALIVTALGGSFISGYITTSSVETTHSSSTAAITETAVFQPSPWYAGNSAANSAIAPPFSWLLAAAFKDGLGGVSTNDFRVAHAQLEIPTWGLRLSTAAAGSDPRFSEFTREVSSSTVSSVSATAVFWMSGMTRSIVAIGDGNFTTGGELKMEGLIDNTMMRTWNTSSNSTRSCQIGGIPDASDHSFVLTLEPRQIAYFTKIAPSGSSTFSVAVAPDGFSTIDVGGAAHQLMSSPAIQLFGTWIRTGNDYSIISFSRNPISG